MPRNGCWPSPPGPVCAAPRDADLPRCRMGRRGDRTRQARRQRDPGNSANHLALSRAWASSTRPEAVANQLAAAREAVLIDPNSTDAQVQIGAALAADGDVDAARVAYFEALRRDPGNTAALNNLAVLEMQSGSAAEAARHLASALAANPQGVSARRNLDALAVLIARRAGRWMLLAPFPALVAAAAGLDTVARILAILALVSLPTVGFRWWRALTGGRRRPCAACPAGCGRARGLADHRRVRGRWGSGHGGVPPECRDVHDGGGLSGGHDIPAARGRPGQHASPGHACPRRGTLLDVGRMLGGS